MGRKVYFDNYDNSKLRVNDESSQRIMDMLSATLRRDVMKQMVKGIESQIAFLRTRSADFVSEVSKCLVRQTCTEGELLFKEDEPLPHQICFLTQGRVNVFKGSDPTNIQSFEALSESAAAVGDVSDDYMQRPWLMEDIFATDSESIEADGHVEVYLPTPPANVGAEGHVEVYLLFRVRFNTVLGMDGLQDDGVQFLKGLSSHGTCSHLHVEGREQMWEDIFDGNGAFEIEDPDLDQISPDPSPTSHQRKPSLRIRNQSMSMASTASPATSPRD